MSVYKELSSLVKNIRSRSRQIWNDAADFGAAIGDYNDPLIKQVKGLMEQYGVQVKTERHSTGFTQTYEFDGGAAAFHEAGFSNRKITFTSAPLRNNFIKGYLEVETWSTQAAVREARKYQDY